MSSIRKRKRTLVLRDDTWRSYLAGLYDRTGRFRVLGFQETESEGHPWADKGFTGEDIGGPFRTISQYVDDKREADKGHPNPLYNLVDGAYEHHGPLYPINPNGAYRPPSAESDDVTLDAWGTKAIALCKPTSPVVDLSVALGELIREGLPSIIGAQTWKTRAGDSRAAGGEYLNVQFGWLPLISDVRKAAYAVRESDKILAQYERDAGRLVRRNYEFPLEKSIQELTPLENVEPFTGGNSLRAPHYKNWPLTADQRRVYRTRETTIRRWFSGAFTYYIPTSYDSRSNIARHAALADKLYGVSVDPETLWNLAPWSWALDWFGNVGDVVSNVSDFLTDGLVMRYGYMMEHSIVKDTYTLPSPLKEKYGNGAISCSFFTEVKKRRPATPFGFGLTYDGLSTKQKSILAAIGLSRWG